MATYSPESLGIKAPSGGFKELGWYQGRQYVGGQFGDVGVINPNSSQQGAGQAVSADVIKATSPANLQYIQAKSLQAPVSAPYVPNSNQGSFFGSVQSTVDSARSALDTRLATDQTNNAQKMTDARAKETAALGEVQKLTTPFRQDIAAKYQPTIDKEFTSQIELTDQLSQLLTEGQNLIKQQQSITGLDSIRNPRVQRTMQDVAAQAGIIQAVLAQRTTNINTAYGIIDKTVSYIDADRKDQLSYYSTVLNLANRDILALDQESKTLAAEQIGLLKNDLNRAQESADYIKKLMVNPDYSILMAKAGVTLNDSPERISQKLAMTQIAMSVQEQANEITKQGGVLVTSPAGIPANRLKSFTDANGQTYYYKMPAPSGATQQYTTSAAADAFLKKAQTPSSSTTLSVPAKSTLTTGPNGQLMISAAPTVPTLLPQYETTLNALNPDFKAK